MFGSNDLAIGVSLYLRDSFTSQANRASSAMANLQQNASAAARQQANMVRNMNAAGAVMGGTLLRGVGKAYAEFADFNYVMRYTALVADGSTASLQKLSDKALEVGKRTMFSGKEVAEGMRWYGQAGMDSKQIVASIDAAANLAQATKSAIDGNMGSADILAKTSAAFKIDKTQANMERVADILGVGANESLTDLQTFGEGIKYVQQTATSLNMTLEETTAAVMVLSNAGIQGSMTGTSLDNYLRYLTEAASGRNKKKNAALNAIGLGPEDLMDAQRNLLPMSVILAKISKGVQGMGTVDKLMVGRDLFGERGKRALELVDSMQQYNKFLEMTTNSKGYNDKMSKDLMNSPQGQLDILKSTWETFKIQFGGAVAPLITPIVTGLGKVLDIITTITGTPIGKFIAVFGTMFVFMRTATMGYRAIMLSIRLLQAQLGTGALSAATQTNSAFGSMTASASRYAAVLERLRMLGSVTTPGAPGYVGQYRSGQQYRVGAGGGWIPLSGQNNAPGLNRLGRTNQWFGKYGSGMMMGGMALGMLGQTEEGQKRTGLERTASVGGSTLAWAGTGAMIGSIVPGIGNAVGGIVGGIGGLLYGLYTELDDLNKTVNQEDKAASKVGFNKEKVKREWNISKGMNWKDLALLDMKTNLSGNKIMKNHGEYKDREWNAVNTEIVINMDGKTQMRKTFTEMDLKTILNLGLQ